jgi:hypothetical protein
MVAGIVPLKWVRQFDAKRVSENGNDDPVEKQQNRSDNADAHDNADHQGERNSNDCKGILVGHRTTMPPFARSRQGRLSLQMRRRKRANSPRRASASPRRSFRRQDAHPALDFRPILGAGAAQIIIGLQVHPKLRRGAEIFR